MFLISSSREEIIPLKKAPKYWFSIETKTILGNNIQSFLPNDTVTVRCMMWAETMKTGESCNHSALHKVKLPWNIKSFNKSLSNKKVELIGKDNMPFEMSLEKESEPGTYTLIVEELPGNEGWPSFMNCKTFISPTPNLFKQYNSVRTNWRKTIVFAENNTDITLILEFVVAFHKSSPDQLPRQFSSNRIKDENVSQEGLMSSGTLSNDLLHLYNESSLSDVTINTEGRSLAAHRSILAARSSVFRAMFEQDQMSEVRSGIVDIEDIDGDTLNRMLVFLYGDSLEGVNFKEAVGLYYAADKYAVLPLKQMCADILKNQLTTYNACDVLVLADAHSDEQLMSCVVDFISGHQKVMSSPVLMELEEIKPRLTINVMREIFMKKK